MPKLRSTVRTRYPAPYNKTCHAYIVSAPRLVTLQHTPHACHRQHTLGSFLLYPARQIGKVISLKRRSFPCSNQGQGTNASETWKSERFYKSFQRQISVLERVRSPPLVPFYSGVRIVENTGSFYLLNGSSILSRRTKQIGHW